VSLVVTILTGGRPLLLERTLASLTVHQGAVIGEAYVICLINGGDRETWEVVDRYSDLIDAYAETKELLGIGAAASRLFETATSLTADWLLHLEDDWEASPGEWYHQAVALLEDGIFQVRLRRAEEHSLKHHMVTKKVIDWLDGDDYRYTRDAHYTLNPSLIRLSNVKKGWPAAGEVDAQRRFWSEKKRKVAQLVPGIWSHIGEEDSLRKRVGT
jgi:hypothetical protein